MTEDFLERMHMGDQDDDDADLKQLKQLRQVWLDLPEEDPPEHGLSLLMAAARTKAAEMAPRPSWLSRMLATLVRPPVLALATVVVVAGGAVLVHNHREDLAVEQTAVAPTTPPPPPAAGSAGPAGGLRDEQPQAADLVTPSAGRPADQTLEKPTEAPRQGLAEKEAKVATTKPAHAPGAKKPTKPTHDSDDELVGGALGHGDAEGKSIVLSQQPKADPSPPPPPPPPPKVEAAPPAKVSTRAPSNAPVIATDGKLDNAEAAHSGTPSVGALLQKARDAADRGDCTAVKQLAEQIAKLDLSYYRSTVLKDQTVGKCL